MAFVDVRGCDDEMSFLTKVLRFESALKVISM